LFVAAYYTLLLYLRRHGPAVQIGVGLLALWVFGDVAYLSYCNSFYSDTPAMLGLLLMTPLALLLADDPRAVRLWLFAAAAALFVTSKPQHAILGFLPALFALAATWRTKPLRVAGAAVCALLLIAEAGVFWMSPPGYQSDPLFSVIFHKLVLTVSEPPQALLELGLEAADSAYIGQHAYFEDAIFADPRWRAGFVRRASYRRVAAWWLRHPRQAWLAMDGDLFVNASLIRAYNLSNFRQESGHPAGARTDRFASWSTLRARLFTRWRHHIIVWYLLLAAAGAVLWLRNRTARLALAICLGVAAIAVLEFVFASLTDALETHRHLLLFHLATDVTVCFVAGWVIHGGRSALRFMAG
jgi:hypothetical protein